MSASLLRTYQEKVVTSVQDVNAIVKMPTGSGKTIVAAEVIKRHIASADCRGILFLVPSTELVEQQAKVINEWCCTGANDGIAQVFKYRGGISPPSMLNPRHILVATAGAFVNLQEMNQQHFGWEKFSLCVFDEVHHAIKDHPYRKIVMRLSNFRNHSVFINEDKKDDRDDIQVLGLTASLTYQVTERSMESAIAQLCAELCIQKVESPSSSELCDGGYVPPHDDCIEIEACKAVPLGVVPLYLRRNHDMYGVFMKRIDKGEATIFSLKVWEVIQHLERKMKSIVPNFESPLSNEKLKSWEEHAHDYVEMYSCTVPPLLENWYVALRILVQTWEEDEEIVLQWLSYNDAFNVGGLDDDLLNKSVESVEDSRGDHSSQSKLCRLRYHLIEKKREYGDNFRCIVFVQQQITAHVLGEHFLNTGYQLGHEHNVKAGFVVSRGSKITPSIKFNKTMAEETIKKFRKGEINVLVATSVIEEGFDVPAANVVVCYDHMKDAVELCQRFGRARQEERSIIVLDERPDRPVEMLKSVHTSQNSIARNFDPNNAVVDEEIEQRKQKQREIAAYRSILSGRTVYESEPVKKLNEYEKKTKATLDHQMEKIEHEYYCDLKYSSLLREASGSGCASGKKGAKAEAALVVLESLRESLRRDYALD